MAVAGIRGGKIPVVKNVLLFQEQETNQLPHLMKTASSLNFKRIGTFTLVCVSLIWFRN